MSFIRNLKKHLKKKNNLFIILFTAVFISGCSKEPDRADYVARVNSSYLTQNELDAMTDTSKSKNNFYKSEIIRNWIDQELLYQQAVSEGIIDEDEFNRIIDESRKSLAGAILMKQVSEKYDFNYSQEDLNKFFEAHKNEFKLLQNAYVVNLVEFNNESDAIMFRSSAFENGWQKATEPGNNIPFTKEELQILLMEDEIYPSELKNVLVELYPQEVSIIISPDSSTFMIAQLLDKYSAGTVPPFEFIKSKVEDGFVSFEKKKIINEYIKQLYADNDIEIKN